MPIDAINLECNNIVSGDNMEWLPLITDESVDLCYIDPPFFSNKNYEIVWGNSYETRSFGDRFSGGIKHYIGWMRERLILIHRKLKDTATFYLHCDWHASHYLKVVCDDIFGYQNFRNEIVWWYDGPQSPSTKNFATKHDVILRYSKTSDYYSNTKHLSRYIELSEEEIKKYKKNSQGQLYYDLPPGNYTQKSIDQLKKEGRIRLTKSGKVRVMYFLKNIDDKWFRKKNIPSVWDHFPSLGQAGGNERIGYKTQKPESLLNRIIKTSSQKGDVFWIVLLVEAPLQRCVPIWDENLFVSMLALSLSESLLVV